MFRELVQFADGRLGTKFPAEMMPASGPPLPCTRVPLTDGSIGQRHCLINRCPELRGDRLFLFCRNGEVGFDAIEIRLLLMEMAAG